MKKMLFASGLVLLQLTNTEAQETPNPAKADIKKTPVMQAPSRTTVTTRRTVAETPAAETPKPGPSSADYRLHLAKVMITTGNDNKEQPSHVQMSLNFGKDGLGIYDTPVSEYKEFPVNSVTELKFGSLYLPYYPYEKGSLAQVENGGVTLGIYYRPNFLLDAWKIEKVVLTLEFRDGGGNLHPVLGSKEIVFTNVGKIMNKDNQSLICEIDKFLMPTRTYLKP